MIYCPPDGSYLDPNPRPPFQGKLIGQAGRYEVFYRKPARFEQGDIVR